MAMLTATDVDTRPGLFARMRSGFGFALSRAMEARARQLRIEQRREAIQRLNALSDKQLAERNLSREAIVSHVFRDLIHY